MQITLYKECICSHDYNEVFHHEVFENYLSTLSQLVLPEQDLIYQENSGVFNFDLEILPSVNFYEFNYMKITSVENDINIVRYCFVSKIRLINGLVQVAYELDFWQTFSSKLHIRESYLSRCKLIDQILPSKRIYKLPIEYDGHKGFNYTKLNESNDLYYIVLQVQVYDTQVFGEATQRIAYSTFLYVGTPLEGGNYNFGNKFSLDVALYLITKAYERIQRQEPFWNDSGSSQQVYHNISNITLIPESFFRDNLTFMPNYFPEFNNVSAGNPSSSHFKNTLNPFLDSSGNVLMYPLLTDTKQSSLSSQKHIISTFTINNNFKNYSFGTMTNQFEIENDGLEHEIKLTVEMNTYNFDLYMQFDNKEIAITNDFVLNIPYSFMNGEEISQNRISRNINMIKSVGNIVSDLAGFGLSKMATEKAMQMQDIHKTKTMRSKKSQIAEVMKGKLGIDLIGKGVDTGFGIVDGISNLTEILQPNYSTSKGTFSYDDGILNAVYGLIIKSKISQNDALVEDMIEATGYKTYAIVYESILRNKYPEINNVLKFDFVKVYGDFPQDVCDILKEILLNGFKIWYFSNPV